MNSLEYILEKVKKNEKINSSLPDFKQVSKSTLYFCKVHSSTFIYPLIFANLRE